LTILTWFKNWQPHRDKYNELISIRICSSPFMTGLGTMFES
jgi:hypothetical protein